MTNTWADGPFQPSDFQQLDERFLRIEELREAGRRAIAEGNAKDVKPGDTVSHWKWGKGVIKSVDTTTYRADANTPIKFLVVKFDADEIFLPASDVE